MAHEKEKQIKALSQKLEEEIQKIVKQASTGKTSEAEVQELLKNFRKELARIQGEAQGKKVPRQLTGFDPYEKLGPTHEIVLKQDDAKLVFQLPAFWRKIQVQEQSDSIEITASSATDENREYPDRLIFKIKKGPAPSFRTEMGFAENKWGTSIKSLSLWSTQITFKDHLFWLEATVSTQSELEAHRTWSALRRSLRAEELKPI